MSCRVVHMTSVHLPFDTRIFHKECKSLAAAGYAVTLIAAHDGGDFAEDGVKLRSVPLQRGRTGRMTKTIPAVYRIAVEEDADIYHFHDPELMPIGVLLKIRGKKVIYDVHEDYSSNMRKQWIPGILQGPASLGVKLSESALGRTYDRIVAATPKIARQFSPRMTCLVQNFPMHDELVVGHSLPYYRREPLIAYVGFLADTRGTREMVKAMRLVVREMPAKLVIGGKLKDGAQAGPGEPLDQEIIEQLGVIDRSQVADLLARARAGIVVYHPTANYLYGQPTKLLEYMSAALPVVASNFPFYREVVESCNCGFLVDPLDPREIADKLLWILKNPQEAQEMGKRGQQAVAERYSWERESEKLVAVYRELADNV